MIEHQLTRITGIQKKIEELNSQLVSDGQKGISMNPTEVNGLRGVLKTLSKSPIEKKDPSIQFGLDLGIKIITTWPYESRLAALDLLRLVAVTPAAAEYRHPRDDSTIISVLASSVKENDPPSDNHIMMAIRGFVNLFETPEGRKIIMSELELITDFLKISSTSNRNLAVAISTLYINLAVLFTTSDIASFSQITTLIQELTLFMEQQVDSESAYRGLVALGTLVGISDEYKSAAKEVYEVPKLLNVVSGKVKEPRIRNVVGEINAFLA